jgi:DNA-binding beta-propeller fold protein YncE
MSTVAGGGPLPRVDGGPATLGQLNSPRDVVVDGAGNLYIADFNNNLVRKVDKASGTITTVAGTGVAGPALDGVAATSSPLNGPWGLGIDAAGNLYIADSNNSPHPQGRGRDHHDHRGQHRRIRREVQP